ncbi:hypothetical protein ACFL55_00345 [Candidatus Latescibacterota bacterium]
MMLVVCSALSAYGWEPVSALDDGFAVPAPGFLAESAAAYPGAESLIGRPYAVLAWQVPFEVEELAVTTVHAGAMWGRAATSLTVVTSGFDLWGDEQGKLGISYLFLDGLSAGVRITRSAIRIDGFDNASGFSTDAGIVCRPGENVLFAVSVEDLAGATLGESQESLDGARRLSASWRLAESFTFVGGVRDVPRFEPSVTAGFTTTVAEPLTIGAIGGSEPARFEFLAALTFRTLRFAYRGSWHPDLGMSHGCSLVWGDVRMAHE